MNTHSSIYFSPLYRSFKAMDEKAYRAMVHFYERYEEEILDLDFEEYFDLLVAYSEALFFSEEYQKHLLMADVVIETAFEQNILTHGNEDIVQKTLYFKASSHFHLREYPKAIYILSELLKLNPFEEEYIRFLKKNLWYNQPAYFQPLRGLVILIFLLTAVIIAIEMIVIRTLYSELNTSVEILRNCVFATGIAALAVGYGWHFWKVIQQSSSLLKQAKDKFFH
jgi:tetratricopeptide (TPR) repeat protein